MSNKDKEDSEANDEQPKEAWQKNFNVGSPKKKNEYLSRVLLWNDQNVKIKEMAKRCGVTPATVSRWLRSAGIKPKNSPNGLNNQSNPKKAKIDVALEMEKRELGIENKDEVALLDKEFDAYLADKQSRDNNEIASHRASPVDQYQELVTRELVDIMRESLRNLEAPTKMADIERMDKIISKHYGIEGSKGKVSSHTIELHVLNDGGSKKNKTIDV